MGVYSGPDLKEDGLVLALDGANRKSYSHNYHPKPIDGYGWVTSANAATLSRDTIQSPVGNTPLKMVVTGNDPYTSSYNSSSWNIASAAQGQTWTFSVWAKASTSTSGQLFLFEANSSGNYTNYSYSGINITTEWQRFSITRTFTDATTNYVQVRVDGPDSGGTGQTIWWDGFQVERSSSMSTFTSVYTGETSYDLINATNNGTLTNGVSYSDSNNGSFVFDGTNDFISITKTSQFNFGTSDFAIETFCNLTSKSSSYPCIFSNYSSYGSGAIYFGYDHDGVLSKYSIHVNGTGYLSSSSNITYNVWTHLTLVRLSGVLYFYINGVLNGTPLNMSSSLNGNGSLITIGKANDGSSSFAHGKIANFKIYNKALSASEVQQNFNANRARFGI